nr:tetratricopeptide repeat protein [Spirochaetota bacterium]
NIILPGIYIAQKKMPEYKKIIFFITLIILIPSFIFMHKKFSLPFGSELFLKHSNADIFRPEAPGESIVSSNGKIIIKTGGYARMSMERAVFASYIVSRGEKTLILSGYSQFFGIKSLNYFNDGRIFNYVPRRFVDFNRPPLSGQNGPAVKSGDLLFNLASSKEKFALVLDIPNLYDITENRYRFSNSVISLIKSRMNENGIYAILLPSAEKYAGERCSIYGILGKLFAYHSAFVSEDSVIIFSSDSKESLNMESKSLEKLSAAIDADKLFYEDVHFLSKMMPVELNNQNFISDANSVHGDSFTESLYSLYSSENALYTALIPEPELQTYLSQKTIKHSEILSSLKEAEKYESGFEFDKEMQLLFSLKKFQLGFEIFSVYLENTLAAKEKLYIKEAESFEKDKKWEDARNLYKAVLVLNENNFDANCKLGMIAITLQDIDSAFIYFTKALAINPSNNLVNYQMGTLLMARGEYQKALEFLLKALELNNHETKTIFFIGFCYENTGDLLKAESFYKQAFLLDPQDTDIKTAVDRIAKKIEAERNKYKEEVKDNQLESEKDVNFPLPINESALKQRLTEKE